VSSWGVIPAPLHPTYCFYTSDAMRILITNDDGIQSPGLTMLAEALAPLGEIFVVAPDRERSAISQAISLHTPLRAKEIKPNWYMVDGTPVDCVYLALAKLLPQDPDVVVSGINLGANLGQDVFYSGTVGAAMEGCIQGLQSVALSLHTYVLSPGRENVISALEWASKFSVKIIEKALANKLPPGVLLNVNFPGKETSEVAITSLGRRHYGKDVIERRDPRNKKYFWIGGNFVRYEDIPGSDCNEVSQNKISVSPIRLDLNAQDVVPNLSNWGL
jgi:5'-nucleotidase